MYNHNNPYQSEEPKCQKRADKDTEKKNNRADAVLQVEDDVQKGNKDNRRNAVTQHRDHAVQVEVVSLVDQIHKNEDQEGAEEAEAKDIPEGKLLDLGLRVEGNNYQDKSES